MERLRAGLGGRGLEIQYWVLDIGYWILGIRVVNCINCLSVCQKENWRCYGGPFSSCSTDNTPISNTQYPTTQLLFLYLPRCFNGRNDARAGDNNGGGGAFGGEDDFVVAVEGVGIGLSDLML